MLRGFVSPELMYFEASTNAIVATIIGGTGTLIGPLYGSVILVFLKSIIGTDHASPSDGDRRIVHDRR